MNQDLSPSPLPLELLSEDLADLERGWMPGIADPLSNFDAPRGVASRDILGRSGAQRGTSASKRRVTVPVEPDHARVRQSEESRLFDLLERARARPQLAAGAVAAVALAVGTLVWSRHGRSLLTLGSGYLAERLYGTGLRRQIGRVLTRAARQAPTRLRKLT